MLRKLSLPALVLAGLLAAGCASAAGSDAPAKASDGVLVGANGMTLYTFDRDATPGKSACNGPCAANWPPLAAATGAAASGDWSIITRDDGSKQWVYKGKPVYFWSKDQKPGDRTGDGFNGVWQLARP
jgi:predicted lipoprotein with Yx(FWY)xxD motif